MSEPRWPRLRDNNGHEAPIARVASYPVAWITLVRRVERLFDRVPKSQRGATLGRQVVE